MPLADIESRVTVLENNQAEVLKTVIKAAVADQKIEAMDRTITEVKDEVKSLRRAMIGFSLSISLSAIVYRFAFEHYRSLAGLKRIV